MADIRDRATTLLSFCSTSLTHYLALELNTHVFISSPCKALGSSFQEAKLSFLFHPHAWRSSFNFCLAKSKRMRFFQSSVDFHKEDSSAETGILSHQPQLWCDFGGVTDCTAQAFRQPGYGVRAPLTWARAAHHSCEICRKPVCTQSRKPHRLFVEFNKNLFSMKSTSVTEPQLHWFC